MISITYLTLSIIFNLVISFCSYSLLQKSFYSFKRFSFRIKDQIYYYPYLFFLFSLLLLFPLFVLINPSFSLLTILSFISALLFIIKVKGKVTKRFLRLYILNNILFIISTFLIYKFNPLLLPINFYLLIINIPATYYLLEPYEKFKREKTYLKAKQILNLCPNLKIVGITGSYGKTTVRNFLLSLIHPHTYLSPRKNINTPLGVANFIINNVTIFDRLLVLELGIDEIDGMDEFKKFLNLDIAVITSIGEQHLRTFKNIENITLAKSKISTLVKDGGTIFYPNNYHLEQYFKKGIILKPFSKNDYQLFFKDEKFVTIRYKKEMLRIPFKDKTSIQNAFLAYLISLDLYSSTLASLNLAKLTMPKRRKNSYEKDNVIIIDDSYNLNLKGLAESIKKAQKLNKPLTIITGGLFETNANIRLLFNFYNQINHADKIYYLQKLLPIEKKIIFEIPGLKEKIILQKNFPNIASGTILILTIGEKSSLK